MAIQRQPRERAVGCNEQLVLYPGLQEQGVFFKLYLFDLQEVEFR